MLKIEGYNKQRLQALMEELAQGWRVKEDAIQEYRRIQNEQDNEGIKLLEDILDLETEISKQGGWKAPSELLAKQNELYNKIK